MTVQAHSIDGRTFGFEASTTDRVPIGGYVTISHGADQVYLGQVLDAAIGQTAPTGGTRSLSGGDGCCAAAPTRVSSRCRDRPSSTTRAWSRLIGAS